MLASPPPPSAAAAAAAANATAVAPYDIGQNFTSALAIGAAAIVCTLALLAFYFCRYVSLDRDGGGGGGGGGSSAASGYLSGSSQWSSGGAGGGGAAAEHLEKIPVVGAGDVAGRIKGGEFCAVCLTDFQFQQQQQQQQQQHQQQSRMDSIILGAASDRLRFLPRCSHCFHCDCVDEWLKTHLFCPVCRTSLVAAAATTAAGSKSPSTASATDTAPPPPPPPPPPPEQLELRIAVADDPGARSDRDRGAEHDREQTKGNDRQLTG